MENPRMKILSTIVATAMLLLVSMSESLAQQTTEIFIPIGESPGLSTEQTNIGRIEAYDAATRTLTVLAPDGLHPVRITEDTHIWLDRSGANLSNAYGDTSDFVSGRRVEVSYVDPAKRQSASWVKVETSN